MFIPRLALVVALALVIDGAATNPAAGPAPAAPDAPAAAAPATTDPTADATGPNEASIATAASITQSTTYQETSSRLTYRGSWGSAAYSGYLGGRAKYSRQKGASATFSFTGTGISWIGPVGPTRGNARVYVNGAYVKTVSLYARTFTARRTVLSLNYATQRTRTLKIVVLGTSGRPMVAIDALVVRSIATSTASTTPTTLKVVQIGPSGGQSAFLAQLRDMSVDVIELQAGTYRDWHVYIDIDRTRPVLVRPAPGAAVVWDATGSSNPDGLFYFGYHSFSSDIRIDPAGTGGSFTIQNYQLGQQGLVNTFWVDRITVNGFRTTGIGGLAGGQLSWTFYVSSDGSHRGTNITANDWNVGPSAGRTVGGLQTYHNPQAKVIKAYRWRISGASTGMTLYGDATGIDVQGWTIANCEYAVYSDGVAGGVLKNNTSTGSTTPPVIRYPLIDGGGNSWR